METPKLLKTRWWAIFSCLLLAMSPAVSNGAFDWESLPDFSHAGYKGGIVEIPTDIPTVIVVEPGSGDDTKRIQNAINALGNRATKANGYRGAVVLKPGEYQVSDELRIDKSGVVLRGSGQGSTKIIYSDPSPSAQAFRIGGEDDDSWKSQVAGSIQPITTPLVKAGSYAFMLKDASSYRVGDEVVVWHDAKSEWFESINQGGVINDVGWGQQTNWDDVRYRRIITSVDGNLVTLDAPVFMDLDHSLASLWLYKYDRPQSTTNIGIEGFAFVIATPGNSEESNIRTAIRFVSTDHSWARDVTVSGFRSSGFSLRGAVYCTIESCNSVDPHSIVRSTRRYNFNTDGSQLILFKNCFSRLARHAYISNGHANDSGIVFLDCEASENFGTTESHQRWATGLLFDNLVFTNQSVERPSQAMKFGNNGDNGNAHGWNTANSVAWRCNTSLINNKILLQDPPGSAQNYAIGCIGSVTGDGPYPGTLGHVVTVKQAAGLPQSLYKAQLAKRLQSSTDNSKPSTPGNVRASASSPSSITLTWSKAGDNLGVASYSVYRDGKVIASTTETQVVDDELMPATVYDYRVVALDRAGNRSNLSATTRHSTVADKRPPARPANLSASQLSAYAVSLSWSRSADDFGVAYYNILQNGNTVGTSSAESYLVSGISSNTRHSFSVVAVDWAGKTSPASSAVSISTQSAANDPSLWLGMAFEEGLGATVFDASKFMRDGTLRSGVDRSEQGKWGEALKFSGAGGKVDLGTMDIPGSKMTIGVWIRPKSFSISDSRIISKASGTQINDHSWMLSTVNERGVRARFRLETFEGITSTLIGDSVLSANKWTHLAATYDGERMRLYVNGILDGVSQSRGVIVPGASVPVAIGDQPEGGKSFDGLIDEVRIYTRAMSASELSAAMNEPISAAGVRDDTKPTTPTGPEVTLTADDEATILWNPSTDNIGVLGYIVYRNGVDVGGTVEERYVDAGLSPSSTYNYAVSAFDQSSNESGRSRTVTVRTPAPNSPPSKPQKLKALGISDNQIKLTWEPSRDDGFILRYNIFRNSQLIAESPDTAYTDEGLSASASYTYQIQAVDNKLSSSPVSDKVSGKSLPADTVNAVKNGGFESGMANWKFFSNGSGSAVSSSPSYIGARGAVIRVEGSSSNIQLFQNSVGLEPNKNYRLTFAAYSNSGRDLRVSLSKHSSPFSSYGLSRVRANLDKKWKTISIDFRTSGFSNTVENGRFYFWFASDAVPGDVYYIDNISLSLRGAGNAPDTEPPTKPSNLAVKASSGSSALLTWNASTDNKNVVEYIVYRDGSEIATVASPSFTDENLQTGRDYSYRIVAVDAARNKSAYSNTVKFRIAADNKAPSAPAGLSVSSTSQNAIGLSWKRSTDDGAVVAYKVYRDAKQVGTSSGLTYLDTGLAPNRRYRYQVRALDDEQAQSILSSIVEGSTLPAEPDDSGENSIANGDFELGMAQWKFYTNGSGSAVAESPGRSGTGGAVIKISKTSSNIQLYQNDVRLLPNTKYRLKLSAYSSSGRDLRMSLAKHSSPYTNYGLNRSRIDLGSNWKSYSIDFTTTGFSKTVENGRFYFWLASDARAGDVYYIDDIELAPLQENDEGANEAPSIPSSLSALAISKSAIKITWNSSTDDGTIREYKIYRNAKYIGKTSNLDYTDQGLGAGLNFQYRVEAVDNDGESSGLSNTVSASTDAGSATGPNVLKNGDFENGLTSWKFYTNSAGDAKTNGTSYSGSSAIKIQVHSKGTNSQLFQNDISLDPNTEYRLSFAAYSNSGHDLRLSLSKHSSPYTNYGINRERVDLSTGWKIYTLDFKTSGINSKVVNGRLFFWFATDARPGDIYYIDDIELAKR